MAVLSTIPEYPGPGREVQIITLPNFGGNFVRLWVTSAPEGSELAAQLKAAAQSTTAAPRVEWKTVKTGTTTPIRYTFDKGGAYTFAVQEYELGSTFGGGYQYAEDTAQTETKTGNEQTLTIYVGQRMTCKVGAGADTAKLVLWVWHGHIRPTTIGTHGEASPAITEASSKRAVIAAVDPDVLTAVAALANSSVITALGTPVDEFKSVVGVFNQHVNTVGSVHAETNNLAKCPQMYASATKLTVEGVAALNRALRLHLANDENDPAGDIGPGSSTAHTAADTANVPIVTGASEDDLVAAVSDLWRCYETHRVTLSSVHGAADSANDASALPPLMTVHRYFFAALASTSPSSPPGQSSGATLLAQSAGFKEEPK